VDAVAAGIRCAVGIGQRLLKAMADAIGDFACHLFVLAYPDPRRCFYLAIAFLPRFPTFQPILCAGIVYSSRGKYRRKTDQNFPNSRGFNVNFLQKSGVKNVVGTSGYLPTLAAALVNFTFWIILRFVCGDGVPL
jgi:hypothetical protein